MNRTWRWALLALTPLCMAISIPSCPGSSQIQDQLDQFEKRAAEDQKRIAALEAQTKLLREEMEQAKVLFQDMGNTILADSKKIEAITQTLGHKAAPKPQAKPPAKPVKSSSSKPRKR